MSRMIVDQKPKVPVNQQAGLSSDATARIYDKHAAAYREGNSRITESILRVLNRFTSQLNAGDSILEIGFGSGRDARYFADQGFKYHGVDPSIELTKIASKSNPDLIFQTSKAEDMDLAKKDFDGFYALASLVHTPHSQMLSLLKNIRKHLKENAHGAIAIKDSLQDYIRQDVPFPSPSSNDKRTFFYYKEDQFRNLLQQAGFKILDKTEDVFESKGEKFLNFFVQAV